MLLRKAAKAKKKSTAFGYPALSALRASAQDIALLRRRKSVKTCFCAKPQKRRTAASPWKKKEGGTWGAVGIGIDIAIGIAIGIAIAIEKGLRLEA